MKKHCVIFVAIYQLAAQCDEAHGNFEYQKKMEEYEATFNHSKITTMSTTTAVQDTTMKVISSPVTITSFISDNRQRMDLFFHGYEQCTTFITDGERTIQWTRSLDDPAGTAVISAADVAFEAKLLKRRLTPLRYSRRNDENLAYKNSTNGLVELEFYTGENSSILFKYNLRQLGKYLRPVQIQLFAAPSPGNFELGETTTYKYAEKATDDWELSQIEIVSHTHGLTTIFDKIVVEHFPQFANDVFVPEYNHGTKVIDSFTGKSFRIQRDLPEGWEFSLFENHAPQERLDHVVANLEKIVSEENNSAPSCRDTFREAVDGENASIISDCSKTNSDRLWNLGMWAMILLIITMFVSSAVFVWKKVLK